jgi:glycosyltransferase involved in cell wall biosynthesis
MTDSVLQRRRALDEVPSGDLPVTLVVPVRDEAATLGPLIRSIDAQTRRPSEVIFVDGGSSDRTVDIIAAKAEVDARYRIIEADGPATPGRGRNLGVAAARHDWVAMTDAGIRVEPTWLEALWQARLGEPAAQVVYGNFEFEDPSFFEECAIVVYGAAKRGTPAGPLRGPTTVSLMVRKEAFKAAGGFPDLRAGEDDLFLQAVEDRSIPVTWAPDATVHWRFGPTWRRPSSASGSTRTPTSWPDVRMPGIGLWRGAICQWYWVPPSRSGRPSAGSSCLSP